ncbi:MAG TPA: hypothetical protein VK760_10280, partial [Candidatus Acidoferrales bacterium]|nr:hypothetical protein [Candidatus Acidoferrales bacterium]
FQLVANAHNDIIPIDAILAAAVLAKRYPYAAFGAIAIAGLVKLPYAILGLPVLAVVRSKRLRFAGCAAAVAAAVAGSWLGGGQAYARALTNHSFSSHVQNAWHVLPLLLAAAALAIAVAGGRRLIGALWIVPSIGAFSSPVLFPWYLAWSVPYAIARRRVAGFLLIAFPLAAAMITPELMRAWTLFFVFPLAVALSVGRTPGAASRALRPE